MAKKGPIEDIGQGIDLIAERLTGRGRGFHIRGIGRRATIEEMMTSHHAGGESGVTLRISIVGGEILEIEIVIIGDDEG